MVKVNSSGALATENNSVCSRTGVLGIGHGWRNSSVSTCSGTPSNACRSSSMYPAAGMIEAWCTRCSASQGKSRSDSRASNSRCSHGT